MIVSFSCLMPPSYIADTPLRNIDDWHAVDLKLSHMLSYTKDTTGLVDDRYKQVKAVTAAWLAQSVERTTLSTPVLESYGRGFEPRIGLTFCRILAWFLFLLVKKLVPF